MQINRRETLTRLMREHGNAIFRMCYLHLHDVQLAEDAAQETFLKAYRHLDSFRGDCSEKTWLTGIAINVWNVICQGQIYPKSKKAHSMMSVHLFSMNHGLQPRLVRTKSVDPDHRIQIRRKRRSSS